MVGCLLVALARLGTTGFLVHLFLVCFHVFLGVESLTAAFVFSFL